VSLYRAQKLIDLACSSTHEEEARTAALTACRLIQRHRLTLSEPAASPWGGADFGPRTRGRSARPEPAPPPAPPREKPPNGGQWSKAARAGRCASCGDPYDFGDDVYAVAGAVWCARH
jgi:hypothetical protein